MLKSYITLIFIHAFIFLGAQNYFYGGASYGESALFRNQQSNSYYNYTNQELSLFVGKNVAWKSNNQAQWNKYWVWQFNQNFSQYHFLQENIRQNTYATMLSGGIKLEKPITRNLNLEGTLFLGAGYHSGLNKRLASGIYFREAIVLGISKPWASGFSNFLGIGFQHASNANIYELNRGYELLFVKIGITWPKKSL